MIITNRKTLFLSTEEIKEAIVDYIANKLDDQVSAKYLRDSNAIIVSGGSIGHEFIVSILDNETKTVVAENKENTEKIDNEEYEDHMYLEFGSD